MDFASVYVPPRPLAEIEADIRALETDIVRMLGEITGSGAEQAPWAAPPCRRISP